MQKITPNLWFNGVAREAAEFYVSVFPDSHLGGATYYPESVEEGLADFQKPLAGKELTVEFSAAGQSFIAINAGPEFTPTPANSFMVNFDPSRDGAAREHLDQIWARLIDGGEVMMTLDEYPFSKHYGWVKDKYGYSWQLMLTNPDGEERPFIMPVLMFSDVVQNRAREAMEYYQSVFTDSRGGTFAPYVVDTGPAKAGAVMFADFMIEGQWFAIMDAGGKQDYTFNEAVSYAISCADQEEIDYYWEKLSAHPENEQCGWCKDMFGVSWQIVPGNMDELMQKPGAYKTLMRQKKIVIDEFGRDAS